MAKHKFGNLIQTRRIMDRTDLLQEYKELFQDWLEGASLHTGGIDPSDGDDLRVMIQTFFGVDYRKIDVYRAEESHDILSPFMNPYKTRWNPKQRHPRRIEKGDTLLVRTDTRDPAIFELEVCIDYWKDKREGVLFRMDPVEWYRIRKKCTFIEEG